MRFSVRLNNDLPLREYARLARAAEAAGFDQIWVSHDLFLRSAPVLLATMLQATERIAVGSGVLNPYTLHPAEIAMLAATLDELSGGRFLLGLAAGAANFLEWIGVRQERPLGTTRQAIRAIRAVLAGEPVPGWGPEAYLRFPACLVPIYLGAMSPGMLRLAGELADGVLPLLFPPEHFATVAPLIAEGAARAGRSLDEIDLAACVWCSIADDRDEAEAVLRDKIAYYGSAFSPLILERFGLTRADFEAIDRALQVERDPARARRLVTESMLQIGLVGTPEAILPRLERLVEMGARHLSFGPPLGPDPVAAIELLGRAVLPHFGRR
ncbi:LLM class flavin-dependent oxidoreductase [Thermomicrobiaceae bacterium CFH 74404]|uniref:LLM class flavin-dependent oxidoreductase n=1 Tax=Thermalbibacter longus TaxID=2951981 RepID=A0AA41WC23_9BACT|nr:LLM class flavin-dependent oxidoreductase [Thermalbibacter longus]MCM8747654.1 LLM class flavin-dependent oxidoreductase [Thermalbibacter longus]